MKTVPDDLDRLNRLDGATPHMAWPLRLHRALMPDYNRKASAYWWLAVAAGAVIFVTMLLRVLAMPAGEMTVVFAGVALAMVAGLFPVRIPRWKNSFTAGEVFIFMLLLLHGPAAATLAAAAEGLLGSWRTSKRWTSRLATPAMASIAMSVVGTSLSTFLAALQVHAIDSPSLVLLATLAAALIYFALNTLLITAVFYLKRSTWPQAQELLGHFGWIGVTYGASATVAGLLFLSSQQSGVGILLAAAPIIALLLVALHYHFRHQEVEEAVQHGRLEAAEREARIAETHVRELQASEQRFHSAFSHASIGMALVDFDARVLQANAALCQLLGFATEDTLKAQPILDFVDPTSASELLDQVTRLREGHCTSFSIELRLRHRTGTELWAWVNGSRFAEMATDTPCLILQLQDVTARRMAEAGLQHIAFHDSLTGLPNRHRFQQVLSNALERARAQTGRPFGLMFMDFDRFKLINDSLGHAVGDEFLKAVAKRIQHQLRPSDVVARLGGDEFAILAEDLDSERYAVALADRLLDSLRQPFHVSGSDISTSVSIGITFSGNGYTVPADMLRDADIAMYKAKSAGKARYALFDAALHTEVAHRMRLENDLRHAMAAGQIIVHYQPLFDLQQGCITGFEALARWRHAELGDIDPEVFVPVAEDTGLVVALTDFVLSTACADLSRWHQRHPRWSGLDMHVNLSGIDVAHPTLVARINKALGDAGLRPNHLTLDLTENTLMRRLEGALPALNQLRRSGVGLSVDDFGTGYSSLRHLSSLPVNVLKLDRCFVADLGRGSNETSIVRSIVLMGQSLGKAVMAEGIETAEQLELLKQAGCHAGQGYFLGKPMTAEHVATLLDGLPAEHAPTRGARPGGARPAVH